MSVLAVDTVCETTPSPSRREPYSLVAPGNSGVTCADHAAARRANRAGSSSSAAARRMAQRGRRPGPAGDASSRRSCGGRRAIDL